MFCALSLGALPEIDHRCARVALHLRRLVFFFFCCFFFSFLFFFLTPPSSLSLTHTHTPKLLSDGATHAGGQGGNGVWREREWIWNPADVLTGFTGNGGQQLGAHLLEFPQRAVRTLSPCSSFLLAGVDPPGTCCLRARALRRGAPPPII